MIKEIDLPAGGGAGPAAAARRGARGDGVFRARHTIPTALLDDAYGLLGEFFALPSEAKLAYRVPGTNGQAGYTPALIETAERSQQADWKELFHWGRPLPPAHPLRRCYPSRSPDLVLAALAAPG